MSARTPRSGTYVPQPGDIFLTRFGGPLGWFITAMQGLVAGDWSRYSHAGVFIGNGKIVHAQGRGAVIEDATKILNQRPLAILPVPYWADRRLVVHAALSLVGRPYGWFSYLWIGLSRLGIRPGWLRRFLASDRTLICSALADRAWLLAGIHAFNDGRILGEVTPGDLAHVGWVHHIGTGPYRED